MVKTAVLFETYIRDDYARIAFDAIKKHNLVSFISTQIKLVKIILKM